MRVFSELTSNLFVCEPDEYSVLVRDLKKSGLIKNHRSGLRTVKNSFAGKDFVDWVVKTKGLREFLILVSETDHLAILKRYYMRMESPKYALVKGLIQYLDNFIDILFILDKDLPGVDKF